MLGRTNTGSGGSGGGMGLTIIVDTVRPEKPTHNMIWVDSDVDATSYALTAAEPENPEAGTLWISIGDSGKIKAVSPVGDNWITVYPLSVKQYIDGAWVSKTAKSYQNGEWVNWLHFLFKSGKGVSYPTTQYSDKNASITIENDKISLYALGTSTQGYIGNVLNIGPVNMTTYKTLCVDMEYLTANTKYPDWQPAIGVSKTEWTNFDKHLTTDCVKFNAATFERKIVTFPIESYSGEMYFVWNGSGEANIYNIWVE